MTRTKPFDEYSSQYEDWFDRNKFTFKSELLAIKEQMPKSVNGIEVGIGSGRFAVPLDIKIGIEPSKSMRYIAKKRHIDVINGVAENLPFKSSQFDFVLMVTTICFVDDINKSFHEVYRILKQGGLFIIGFIDRESPIGKIYQQHKEESLFYNIATFYTVRELISHLENADFKNFNFFQTIFHNLSEIENIEPIKEGYSEGSFVVIKAIK